MFKFILLGTLISFVILVIGSFFWATYPWELNTNDQIFSKVTQKKIPLRPSTLKLMTWNMAYAYGVGSDGVGYNRKSKDFILKNLDEVVRIINEVNPDIVCLQEVDFEAKRSGYVNQAEYLFKHLPFSYMASSFSWDINYLPFPYYDLQNHFGQIKSGQVILSKYPIVKSKTHLLDTGEHPFWYKMFLYRRYLQLVEIKVDSEVIEIGNTHLEAFEKNLRMKQAKQVAQFATSEKLDFLCGDFNSVPSVALKKSGFYDEVDYFEDTSLESIASVDFNDVIDLPTYQTGESAYFTFPSDKPDRKIDYIFYQKKWTPLKSSIIPFEGSLPSDHFPLVSEFNLFKPEFIRD